MKAKVFSAFFAPMLILAFVMISLPAKADIQTVPFVDVSKYLGDWYQIAHVPLFFEGISDCSCARQRLGLTPKAGVVSVLNTCTKSDGSAYSIAGTATDEDTATNAKFSVSLAGVPFQGSYWIIGIDTAYRYAVVTDSDGGALYILSKTPTLPKNLYKEAVAIAAKQVDTSKLAITHQQGCTYPQ